MLLASNSIETALAGFNHNEKVFFPHYLIEHDVPTAKTEPRLFLPLRSL